MTTISDKQIEGVSEKSKSKLGLRELLNPFHDQQYLSLPHILDQNPHRYIGNKARMHFLQDRGSKELPMIHFTQELRSLVKWPLLPARCKSRTLHIFALQKIAACRGPIGPLPGKKRAKPFG